MRNELIKLGNNNPHILKSVIDQSTAVCKRRFEKPVLTENSHMILYRKFKKLFDNKQMFALRELYRWRDSIARMEDESIGYVLPNHMLLQIAEILPREMQGILACCNPIPPLVRANLLEIHKIILRARDQSLIKPILSEEPRSLGSVQTVTRLNVENPLNCPHDVINSEFRDDLPTLLGDIFKKKNEDNPTDIKDIKILPKLEKVLLENTEPIIDIFDEIENSLEVLKREAMRKVRKLKFLGPFERYKLVKPYMQAEEEKREEFLTKEKIPETTVSNGTMEKLPERIVLDAPGETFNFKIPNDILSETDAISRKVTEENGGIICVQIDNNKFITDESSKGKNQVRLFFYL